MSKLIIDAVKDKIVKNAYSAEKIPSELNEIINQEKNKLDNEDMSDVSRMLVKFSILEGELNKFIIDATDPEGPGGESVTELEKKKI